MKRSILLISSIATALVFCASATQRADAHGVPSLDGGRGLSPHHYSVFNATYVLTKGFRTTAAVPCVENPATPEPDGFAGPYPCRNIDLAAYVDTNIIGAGGTGSDIWGWTDPLCGREYAIQGHAETTTFVDVTIPEVPIVRGVLPHPVGAPGAVWREVKVYNNHAYIVQDLIGDGVQIFDLTKLRLPPPAPPCGVPPVVDPVPEFLQDGLYQGSGAGAGLGNIHTITINEATGFAYANGSNTCNAGPHMFDLKPNPKAPVFAGCVAADGYTHDAQCVFPYHGPDAEHHGKEICVLYNEDTLTVVDVSDKSNPIMLERQGYPTAAYTHQGWFTENQDYIVSDDELDEGTTVNSSTPTKTYLWDASDIDDAPPFDDADGLERISTFIHPNTRTASPTDTLICIDHNQYVLGNLVYQSDYACGLRIYDLSGVGQGTLTEVAHFDTMPATDISFNIGGDLTGDWSNYPYFESGTVVVSNITEGLFVLQPRLSPTAVKLASFTGRQTGKRVSLAWRTAAESDILGFKVFRYSQGKRVKVTKSLVPAKGLGRVGGARYSFIDRNARPGTHTYKLQVVSKDGRRAFKASATVRVRR